MSTTLNILRKDLSQFRVMIGLLLGLLAVLVALRFEGIGSVIPDPDSHGVVRVGLEAMLVMVTVILAGKTVSNAVFDDSPGRQERFLATRPVATHQVLLAKTLFLAAFLAGPFALAAAVYLALSGMPGRVVFLGTLQSLVRSGVLIALAVPFILLWETRRRLIAGLVAAGLGIAAFTSAIGLLFMRGFPFRPDVFADQLVQVQAVAIGAFVLGMMTIVHFRRPLGLVARLALLLLTGIVAPLLAGISSSWQPKAVAEEIPRCEMVELGFNATYSDGKPVLGISLTPSTPTPPDQDTYWDFARLRLGENDEPLRPLRDPRRVPMAYLPGQFSRGIEAALRRHLGTGWAIVSDFGSWSDLAPTSATAFARSPRIPDGPASVDTLLYGHRFSWHCVAELPFTPGSSVRDGDATWTFGRFARDDSNGLAFSFRHVGPELWLGPRGRRGSFEDRGHVFAVLDPERRVLTILRQRYPQQTLFGGGTACPRRGLLLRLEGGSEMRNFAGGDPTRLRLLVLRPSYEGTQYARWTSPSPVDLPTPRRDSSGSGLAHDVRDLEPADIARWIDANPPPPATASDTEIVPYLVELLERTNRCGRLREEHPAVAALAAYVPDHLDLLLRALDALHMDQHASRDLLLKAIFAGMEHRQLPEVIHQLANRSSLLGMIEERGWFADVVPELVRLVRNGSYPDRAFEMLAQLPDAGGLSKAEWLAVFRLSPSEKTYRALRQIPGLENELNAFIDARLDSHVPVFSDHELNPLLKLALARGHADAPVLMHRAIRYAIGLERSYAHWLSDDVTRHFELSGYTGQPHDDEAVVAWFLAQDPTDFIFDPASRKYQLRSAR